MPAILERKLPPVGAEQPLMTRIGSEHLVVDERWVLIVRRKTARGWEKRGRPALSERCGVVIFEDLVAAYGGPGAFNALVGELLDIDYFGTWLK